MAWEENLQEHRTGVLAAAVVVPPACCASLAAFRSDVPNATSALVLVLVIVAVAATGNRVAGLVAALSSGVWFDFFLTEPFHRFTVTDPDDIEAMVLLVVVGAAVTELALWGRRQQARASRRSGYLDGVMGTAEIIAARQGPSSSLTDHVSSEIEELLAVDECRFDPHVVQDVRYAILARDGSVTRGGHPVNVERDGLPTDERTTLVVRHGGATCGQFLITSASRVARPTLEQRRVAVLLADQLGGALTSRAD
jgi:K+-sensing histidine kinase KdpD